MKNRTLYVKVPWVHPLAVTIEECFAQGPSGILDLNAHFRDHLISKAIVAKNIKRAQHTYRKLNAKNKLGGEELLHFYRIVRWMMCLKHVHRLPKARLLKNDELLGELFSRMGSFNKTWYFTEAEAIPRVDQDLASLFEMKSYGLVRDLFSEFLNTNSQVKKTFRTADNIQFFISHPGQVPFVQILLTYLKSIFSIKCTARIDPWRLDPILRKRLAAELVERQVGIYSPPLEESEIIPSLKSSQLKTIRRFCSKTKGMALEITWKPTASSLTQNISAKAIRKKVRYLSNHGISVHLVVLLDSFSFDDEESQLFGILDEIIELQWDLASLEVHTVFREGDLKRSSSKEWPALYKNSILVRSILLEQLECEFDNPNLKHYYRRRHVVDVYKPSTKLKLNPSTYAFSLRRSVA